MAITCRKPWCRYYRKRISIPGCFRSRARPPSRGNSLRRRFTGSPRRGALSINSPLKGADRWEGNNTWEFYLLCIHWKGMWRREWLLVRGQPFSLLSVHLRWTAPEFRSEVYTCLELSPAPVWTDISPVPDLIASSYSFLNYCCHSLFICLSPPIWLGDPWEEKSVLYSSSIFPESCMAPDTQQLLNKCYLIAQRNDGDYLRPWLESDFAYWGWCPLAGHLRMNWVMPPAGITFPSSPWERRTWTIDTIINYIVSLVTTSSHCYVLFFYFFIEFIGITSVTC